jgi:hypothetical protein
VSSLVRARARESAINNGDLRESALVMCGQRTWCCVSFGPRVLVHYWSKVRETDIDRSIFAGRWKSNARVRNSYLKPLVASSVLRFVISLD